MNRLDEHSLAPECRILVNWMTYVLINGSARGKRSCSMNLSERTGLKNEHSGIEEISDSLLIGKKRYYVQCRMTCKISKIGTMVQDGKGSILA